MGWGKALRKRVHLIHSHHNRLFQVAETVASMRLRQEDCYEFQTNLNCRVEPRVIKKQGNNTGKEKPKVGSQKEHSGAHTDPSQ